MYRAAVNCVKIFDNILCRQLPRNLVDTFILHLQGSTSRQCGDTAAMLKWMVTAATARAGDRSDEVSLAESGCGDLANTAAIADIFTISGGGAAAAATYRTLESQSSGYSSAAAGLQPAVARDTRPETPRLKRDCPSPR